MTTDLLPPPEPAVRASRIRPTGYAGPSPRPVRYRQVLTGIFAAAPLVALVVLLAAGLGDPFPWRQLLVAGVLAVLVGHGVTVGFHRCFTHRAFVPNRPVKVILGVLGSLSLQGSLIGWVADHRRHHRYADRPGDPHSPVCDGAESLGPARGLWHAHLGWCFTNEGTSREHYCADLLADRDLVLIDRLFVPFAVATFLLPFAIGWIWMGTLAGALSFLLWAGVVRVGITHNFTWCVNSVGHRFGRRPFATRDHSTNVGWLAPFTMGESYHNNHHAYPRAARHGFLRGQVDSSARVIRWMEQLGWVHDVQWPAPDLAASRRARDGGRARAERPDPVTVTAGTSSPPR